MNILLYLQFYLMFENVNRIIRSLFTTKKKKKRVTKLDKAIRVAEVDICFITYSSKNSRLFNWSVILRLHEHLDSIRQEATLNRPESPAKCQACGCEANNKLLRSGDWLENSFTTHKDFHIFYSFITEKDMTVD